jgi:putative endonuclease
MTYYFYIARCNDNSLYSGYCKDLSDRENAHNSGKGAKYTRSRSPVKIIYSEKFESQSEAMQREAEIKKWSKSDKERLVNT